MLLGPTRPIPASTANSFPGSWAPWPRLRQAAAAGQGRGAASIVHITNTRQLRLCGI